MLSDQLRLTQHFVPWLVNRLANYHWRAKVKQFLLTTMIYRIKTQLKIKWRNVNKQRLKKKLNLKSGIPLAVLIPAPATTTTFLHLPSFISRATWARPLQGEDFLAETALGPGGGALLSVGIFPLLQHRTRKEIKTTLIPSHNQIEKGSDHIGFKYWYRPHRSNLAHDFVPVFNSGPVR